MRYLVLSLLALLPAVLVRADEKPAKPDAKMTLREYAASQQGKYAYGLYLKDKKVGFQVEEFKIGKHDGKDVLIVTTEQLFSVTVDGEKSVSEEKSTTMYETEGDGAVVYASTSAKEDGKTTTREAVRKGKAFTLTTKQNGRTFTRKLPIPMDNLVRDREFIAWLNAPERKKGDTIMKWSVSWEEDDVDRKEQCTFVGKKEVVLAGVPTVLFDVEEESKGSKTKEEAKGAKSKAVVFGTGKLYTGAVAGLLTLRMEKEATARKLDGGDVDILAATSIIVENDIGPAREVDKLILEVSGYDDFKFPESHRQVYKKGKTSTLELVRDFRVKKGAELTADEKKGNLKASVKVQSDHETIRALAKKIVGKETDPVKATNLLARWVFRNLKKSYSSNADNALAVLDNKAGDCTEHSLLFVALARAAGIPAREVSGVAFVTAAKPMFGWHAWAEIHDGTQWVSVDPTWNQVFVDATHVKLGEGPDDQTWVNLVGKLKFKVVKVVKKGEE